MGLTDAQLLVRIGRRDGAAFEILLARRRTAVCRHLQRMVHDADLADDLTQEVFLRVWTRADQWDGRGACAGWLLRIATNLALNALRARSRRRELPLDAPAPRWDEDEESPPDWLVDALSPGPEACCLRREQAQLLYHLIDALPDAQRDAVRLAHEAELEMREIAERLGVPEGTVKSRLYYARKTLRQEWRALGLEEE